MPTSIASVADEFPARESKGATLGTAALSVITSASSATANIERIIFPDIAHLSNFGRSKAWGPPKASLSSLRLRRRPALVLRFRVLSYMMGCNLHRYI